MRAGERLNGWTHLVGLALAMAGTFVLMRKAIAGGNDTSSAAALVFALSTLALYAASTLYHGTSGRAKLFWRRADHCAIYLLIAGTYTPLALVVLQGPIGWSLFLAIWTGAALGIARELRTAGGAQPSVALCLGMGWLWLLVAVPLVQRMHPAGISWLVAGAALYTVGTFFFRNAGGLRHAHGVWHLFVLGGTACHYVAITAFIV